ncbi:hypothetical protein [Pseudomonas syringae]|uniref:hypothetical protein n=1 Tax=Pseudomonas syringae TaxID=317 RepID=UPI00165E4540|nr:hypothetical protein [Pseudomonas syringae]QNR42581.1 hypothetical protein D5S12_15030 [Pseudomonas syringae]
MRYKIGEHGIGGRDEKWYYAEYDPRTGDAFLVIEWDNIAHNLRTHSGEERIPMEKAKDQPFYEKAAEIISENHPEWQPL